jgi:hypothetical protein
MAPSESLTQRLDFRDNFADSIQLQSRGDNEVERVADTSVAILDGIVSN